jgi:hypothetical protein
VQTIPELLKAFSKQCEAYKGDAKKVELACLYLFVRQLTPSLPFETFLECFSALADADEDNLKLPETAVARLLPRTKAKAEQYNSRQWSAKEIVGYLALYIDMIREAEHANMAVPMTLNAWLADPNLQKMYLDGAFDAVPKAAEAEDPDTETAVSEANADIPEEAVAATVATAEVPAKKSRGKKTKTTKSSTEKQPTAAGQRVLYTHVGGQQFRGVTTAVEVDATTSRTYVDLLDDSGQLHAGVAATSVIVINDPLPQPAQNVTSAASEIVEAFIVDMEEEDLALCAKYLEMETQDMSLPPDRDLWRWEDTVSQEGVEYSLNIILKNGDGDASPYVDAYAAMADTPEGHPPHVIYEIQPRNVSILGVYLFVLPAGTIKVTLAPASCVEAA